MPYEFIRYEVERGVALLTLHRPERLNAMHRPMLEEILRACDAAEADDAVRALVVTGAGGRAFSSGFDLDAQMRATPVGVGEWRETLRLDFDAVMRFWHLPKPTVAAVRGACLAGACEMAMACDVTVAAADAYFGEPELKFGAGIVAMILPWVVGPKVAKEIILTGEDHVGAERALAIGMVNRVVAAGDEVGVALGIARRIAVMDPRLVKETKRALNRTYELMGMGAALEAALDIDLLIEGEGSPDKRAFLAVAREQGLRAAIAWRDARFADGAR
ncbi:MAG: enoyl-CoA hydratase/isomerase family protein [Ectothiorhodospiraceae bacterium]|nr:enoyl-CoA hydratase/isomerase family protein [Chromatiales bacterium]MCP5154074.1 enoyl-CoA hydratase/isomerase family protein [Ectothiorhodospiraceae bacterium]